MADLEMARCENRRGCRRRVKEKLVGAALRLAERFSRGHLSTLGALGFESAAFFPLFTRGSSKVDVDDNGKRTRPCGTQWALTIQGDQGHQGRNLTAIQVDCNTYSISNAFWADAIMVDILGMLAVFDARFGTACSIQHVFVSDTFDGRIANMSSLEHVVLR